MVKFKDFSRPLSDFPALYFQELFKAVLYIEVLFKLVQTLLKVDCQANMDTTRINIFHIVCIFIRYFILNLFHSEFVKKDHTSITSITLAKAEHFKNLRIINSTLKNRCLSNMNNMTFQWLYMS